MYRKFIIGNTHLSITQSSSDVNCLPIQFRVRAKREKMYFFPFRSFQVWRWRKRERFATQQRPHSIHYTKGDEHELTNCSGFFTMPKKSIRPRRNKNQPVEVNWGLAKTRAFLALFLSYIIHCPLLFSGWVRVHGQRIEYLWCAPFSSGMAPI